MTTQSTAYPETQVPPARKSSTDDRSTMETIEAAAPELKAKLRQMVATGRTRAIEWKGGFQDGVRDRPIQSILIAAAVGAVLGLIVGRRSS